jgi:hypothetical protein
MIRINLLETAERKRRRRKAALPSGTPAIALYVVLLLIEGFLLYYWTLTKDDALVAQTEITNEAKVKLEGFNKLKAERDELKSKMDQEEQQAELFEQIHKSTVGPPNMLLFLAYMLTQPPLANHAERVVQEQIGWNTQWDPDRAWFTSLKEEKDGKVTLSGEAISHHDTDEVLNRLKASIYFQGVHFVSAKVTKAERDRPPLIEFKIEAYLNYDPNVGKQAATDKAGDKGKKGPAEKGEKKEGGAAETKAPQGKG